MGETWKDSCVDLTKARSKSEMIDEARTKGAKVHFASPMDIGHLEGAELEPKHQKYKCRVVLRGNIVKDESGSYAVFTEQGSSQMTAAKVMDIISILPGCAGQAADAVSAYTRQKMEYEKIIENSQIWLSRHLDSSSTTQMATIMVQYGRPSRSSWAKSVRLSFWQDCDGKGNLRKFFWNTLGRKFPIETAFWYTVKKGYSFLCMWMPSKLLERNETLIRCGKYSKKRSRVGRTNIFPWSCKFGMYSKTTWNKQRCCGQFQNHVWITNFCGVNWKITIVGKSVYLFVVLWHGGSCWVVWGSDIVSKQTKRLNNSTKYQLHALMTITSKKKSWNPWENCQKYALKLFWNACTWHVLEDSIFNGQWTNLHDRFRNGPKLATNDWIVWYLTSITHVSKNNNVMCETLQNNADWDCSQNSDFTEDLEDSKFTSGGILLFFGSHTFVPICSNQLDVQETNFSFLQFNRIKSNFFLDEGMSLDGIPALDLWDLIVAILHGNTYQSNQERWVLFTNLREHLTNFNSKTKEISWNDWWSGQCWFCFLKRHFFSSGSFVFENNEAVIKMIIKGRSPTMRHVSRTHRVACDCLFDRINLDPKIQIKYIDTKNQLADKLTKGNFTRDEWNHLVCLFNVSHFSSPNCLKSMSKGTQKDSKIEADDEFGLAMSVRDPNVLASTASEIPVKTIYESQIPLSSRTEQHLRREDLWWVLVHQTSQNGILTRSSLRKKC